jgi:hypothetical protein
MDILLAVFKLTSKFTLRARLAAGICNPNPLQYSTTLPQPKSKIHHGGTGARRKAKQKWDSREASAVDSIRKQAADVFQGRGH